MRYRVSYTPQAAYQWLAIMKKAVDSLKDKESQDRDCVILLEDTGLHCNSVTLANRMSDALLYIVRNYEVLKTFVKDIYDQDAFDVINEAGICTKTYHQEDFVQLRGAVAFKAFDKGVKITFKIAYNMPKRMKNIDGIAQKIWAAKLRIWLSKEPPFTSGEDKVFFMKDLCLSDQDLGKIRTYINEEDFIYDLTTTTIKIIRK